MNKDQVVQSSLDKSKVNKDEIRSSQHSKKNSFAPSIQYSNKQDLPDYVIKYYDEYGNSNEKQDIIRANMKKSF